MAEVAAILDMVNVGFKLSITLFSFAEAVRSVDKEILCTTKGHLIVLASSEASRRDARTGAIKPTVSLPVPSRRVRR